MNLAKQLHLYYLPNELAAYDLTQVVLPSLLKLCPQVKLQIVGDGPTDLLRQLTDAGAICTGPLRDLQPVLTNATLLVAPLKSGNDVKTKIILALSNGLPVLTTTIGASGLLETGGVLIEDKVEVYAERILQLFSESETLQKLSEEGLELVERRYNPSQQSQKLVTFFSEIVKKFDSTRLQKEDELLSGVQQIGLERWYGNNYRPLWLDEEYKRGRYHDDPLSNELLVYEVDGAEVNIYADLNQDKGEISELSKKLSLSFAPYVDFEEINIARELEKAFLKVAKVTNSLFQNFQKHHYVLVENFLPPQLTHVINELMPLYRVRQEDIEAKKGETWSVHMLDDSLGNFAINGGEDPFSKITANRLFVRLLLKIVGAKASEILTTKRWINHYKVGDSIRPHRDTTGDFQAVLCLRTPSQGHGGDLILETEDTNQVVLSLEAGDLLIFRASKLRHWTTTLIASPLEPEPLRATAICRYYLKGGKEPHSSKANYDY